MVLQGGCTPPGGLGGNQYFRLAMGQGRISGRRNDPIPTKVRNMSAVRIMLEAGVVWVAVTNARTTPAKIYLKNFIRYTVPPKAESSVPRPRRPKAFW
jgi:hypothetical protein